MERAQSRLRERPPQLAMSLRTILPPEPDHRRRVQADCEVPPSVSSNPVHRPACGTLLAPYWRKHLLPWTFEEEIFRTMDGMEHYRGGIARRVWVGYREFRRRRHREAWQEP